MITHFAQSLDGRISTKSGDSKWIGNQDNLIHAHRMRALCDGILVGRRTFEIDKPQLNVRHVSGMDPQKIIVGELDSKLDHLISENTWFICENYDEHLPEHCTIILDKSNGDFEPKKILDQLFKKQIHSVYIEGGALTTSCFLKAKQIDQLQIHFAPKLLGSGITGFTFGDVLGIDEALSFRSYRFVDVGGDVMFVGEPKFD